MPVGWFVRHLSLSSNRSKTASPPAIDRTKSGDGSLSSSPTSSIHSTFLSRKRRSAMSSDRAVKSDVKAGPTSADGLPRPKPGIGRDAREDDPWRVENIMKERQPPAGTDWWVEKSDEESDEEDEEGANGEREDASIKETCSMSLDDGEADSQDSPSSPQPPQNKTFHNCGLSTWEKTRAAWRSPPAAAPTSQASSVSAGEDGGETTASETTTTNDSVEHGLVERRQPPPPIRYDAVVRGLTMVTRTFELPGRMTLPDIVDVFVDIWECEKDY